VGRLAGERALTDAGLKFGEHETRPVYGGQSAQIRLNAFPGRCWHGHVKAVQTISAPESAAAPREYEVLIAIDDPSDDLPLGATAEVTIATD
jgi:hypothetical protein